MRRPGRGVRREGTVRRQGEDPWVVPGLEVLVRGGQGGPHRAAPHGLAQVRLPRAAVADQRCGPGVAQDVPDLAGLVHGVDRDHDGPGLPGAEDGEHEVRGVLQHDRDPVPAADAPRREVTGDGVGERVGLGIADPAVEVGQRGAFGGPGDGFAKGVQHRGRRGHGRPLGGGEQPDPRPGGVRRAVRGSVRGHRVSHFCWRWFMPLSQRSGSVARAA